MVRKQFSIEKNPIIQDLLKNKIIEKLIEVLKVHFTDLKILVCITLMLVWNFMDFY